MPSSADRPSHAPRATSPPVRTGIGPIALVFPLCTLILGILWMRHWRPRTEGEHAQPPVPVLGDVPGWAAGRFLPGEAPLSIRLAVLHTDPLRQSLERHVLGERFGREDGEPFRMVLTLRAPAPGAGSAASDLEFDTGGVSVVDEAGLALEPLVVRTAARPRTPADPLRTLLAPPAQKLGAGEEVNLVFWGRAPGAGARIEGLGDPLPLTPRPVPRADLARSLARLDRSKGEDR